MNNKHMNLKTTYKVEMILFQKVSYMYFTWKRTTYIQNAKM